MTAYITGCRGKWHVSYTISWSLAFQVYVPWPCHYLTTSASLLALCDLSLRGFMYVIMVLSATSHFCITTSLSCLPAYHCGVYATYGLNILLVLIGFLSVNMSLEYPVLFTVCCLRYCSVIIGIFCMCLMLHIISSPSLSPSICLNAKCGLDCYPQQSLHVSMVTILCLYSYCRPYVKRILISVSITVLWTIILSQFEGLLVVIVCVVVNGSLFIQVTRDLMGLLKRCVAELGNVMPIGINLICNNARLTPLLLSKHFDGMLNNFYACLHLSLALMLVQWGYGMF